MNVEAFFFLEVYHFKQIVHLSQTKALVCCPYLQVVSDLLYNIGNH